MPFAEDLLRQCLTIDAEIVQKKAELDDLLERKELIGRTLEKVSRAMGSKRFKVAYAHLVKGVSLSECARRFHYTRTGVCKICNDFKEKLGIIE